MKWQGAKLQRTEGNKESITHACRHLTWSRQYSSSASASVHKSGFATRSAGTKQAHVHSQHRPDVSPHLRRLWKSAVNPYEHTRLQATQMLCANHTIISINHKTKASCRIIIYQMQNLASKIQRVIVLTC